MRLVLLKPVMFLVGVALLGTVTLAQVQSMKLLTPQVGWAADRQHLLWTTDDGANWTDITPKKPSIEERIAAVFFVDASTGWVLWSQDSEPQPRFDLSTTTDAGVSWKNTRIPITVAASAVPLAEGARMFFLDESHGWINVTVQGSAAAHPGALLTTQDGGKTWDWKGMVSRGSVYYSSTDIGWVLSPEGDELDVTHDGSKTWQEIVLDPPGAMKDYLAIYHLPRMLDERRGYVEVEFVTSSMVLPALFSTTDSGKTWKFDRRLPELRYASSQTFDETWIAGTMAGPGSQSSVPSKTLTLTRVGLSGNNPEIATVRSDIKNYQGLRGLGQSGEISFADTLHGWILPGKLLSTADRGATWTDITPAKLTPATEPSAVLPVQELPSGSGKSSGLQSTRTRPRYPFPSSTDLSIHLGFDKSLVISRSDMQIWWNESPYFDTSLYLPGSSNRGTDPNLNATWIAAIQGQGWGLIPTWFGLQSACACKKGSPPDCTTFFPATGQFSSDVNTAKGQGKVEADKAIASLQNLQSQGSGIALGTIIYHDIENYAPSSSCSPPVTAFLNGWVSEMQAKGYQAGVYANPGPISSDVSKVSPLPDDIWVAKGDNRLTTWGLLFSDSLWPKNQRMHQYFQDQFQAFGGTTSYQIDGDIDDAQIAAGLGDKLYSGFNFTDVVYQGAIVTWPQGISNLNSSGTLINQSGQIGQLVGNYENSYADFHGFLDNNGVYTNIDISGVMTTPIGVNNKGTVVGSYYDGAVWHGYIKAKSAPSVTFDPAGSVLTAITGINDDNQVVGYYLDKIVGYHAFFFNYGGDKTFLTYDGPGAWGTFARGINGSGQVVGDFQIQNGSYEGFIWNAVTDGSDVILMFDAQAINNNGQVTGPQVTGPNVIYEEATGGLQSVPYDPKCGGPSCFNQSYGINDSAQITGDYWSSQPSVAVGFVATPQ